MLTTLSIQVFIEGDWQDAALMRFDNINEDADNSLVYQPNYVLAHLNKRGAAAVSATLPLVLAETYRQKPWFGFVDDIAPAGASLRWWIEFLGIKSQPIHQIKGNLLKQAVIAPVGNLRIKECVDDIAPKVRDVRFTVDDVVRRDSDFLSYAQERGAASGGATGAGGEAPKLLLVQDQNEGIWIDSIQDPTVTGQRHYLVKYPRGKRTDIDKDILRAEFHYYHELTATGFHTIPLEGMKLLTSDTNIPSLWLPRFDITERNNRRHWFGLESVYSILNTRGYLRHPIVFNALCNVTSAVSEEQRTDLAIEYLSRDLLNIAFGNSDNHGRNMAVIKDDENIKLAPIYDFAPMKMDEKGVTRTTKWGEPLEIGGRYDWQAIAKSLHGADPQAVLSGLCNTASKLIGLVDRLEQRGVPERVLTNPSIGFQHLNNKLSDWGLV